jgi:hypothetical protein
MKQLMVRVVCTQTNPKIGVRVVSLFLLLLAFVPVTAQYIGRSNVFDWMQTAEGGIAVAVKNGKFGYIGPNGKQVIPLQYDIAYPFNGDFALVGHAGKYYHINRSNQILDSMDWPQAPVVYQTHFLVVKEHTVLLEDGTACLQSPHQLSLFSQSGVIAYDIITDSVFQYSSTHDSRQLTLTGRYAVVGAPIATNQGYLCLPQLVEGRKMYVVYDQWGNQLVRCAMEGIDPKLIEVVWNAFVFILGGNFFLRFTALGVETHYQMNELYLKGQTATNPFAFQLCNDYATDQMMLLKHTDK